MTDKRVDKRKNAGLPKRWRFRDGAYYYRVPPTAREVWGGKSEVRLGKTLHEANLVFAEKSIQVGDVRTVRQLADKYELEVIPSKSPATQKIDRYALRFVREGVGHFMIDQLDGADVRDLMYAIAAEYSVKHAHLVRGVISHMYTRAIAWRLFRGIHPVANKQCPKLTKSECNSLGLKPEAPRDRYVTDEELQAIYSVANPIIKAYLPLRLALGQRVGDILTIELGDITDDELYVAQNKTKGSSGARLRFPFRNPDGSENGLRELVEDCFVACRAKGPKARPFRQTPTHLFCTREGTPYFDYVTRTHSGWDSMWQRMMQKARREGLITADKTKRFTDHDLRAKTASDALDLEAARRLMGHTDANVTKRIYRRRGEVVQPLLRDLALHH